MGKYAALGRYLDRKAREDEERVKLTFEEVEEIIPGNLPLSAREHRAWWANTATNHVQAEEGWLGFGWIVESVDIENERVVFEAESTDAGSRLRTVDQEPMDRDLSSREVWTVAADDSMMNHLSVGLRKRQIDPVPKPFSLVSQDESVVGDKTYAKMLEGGKTPYAVHATISETVWLLQQTSASHRFIVFGNDRRVPLSWMERFGHLANGVVFYFLEEDDQPQVIKEEVAPRLLEDPANAGFTGEVVDP